MKRTSELLIVALFLIPLGVLVFNFGAMEFPDPNEVLPFLKSAFIQATISALLSLVIGTLLAVGLLFVKDVKNRYWFEILFLIPGFLPGIFVVLSILQIYSVFGVHPMGYPGVVTANVALSFGLVGVFLERGFREKVGGFAELARVEGASSFKTFVTLSPLMKRDFTAMFLSVFIFSFLGFSIPLILGGLEAATLEVQIYRKVVSEGALSEALSLSILQLLFIAGCSFFVTLKGTKRKSTNVNLSYLGSPTVLMIFIFATGWLLLAPMTPVFRGAPAVFQNAFLSDLIVRGGIGTLVIGLTAGFFTMVLGAYMTYLWPSKILSRFFYAYSAPSAVLIGFGFYLLGYHMDVFAPKIAFLGVVLGLLFWPTLYRISFFASAESLEGQIEIARQMGAEAPQIFKQVTWPQVRSTVCSMAALAGLWAAGDFGISSMLTVEESTLSLLVKNLISRYRLAEATVVLWILVMVAILVALVFLGLNRVSDRKSSMSA